MTVVLRTLAVILAVVVGGIGLLMAPGSVPLVLGLGAVAAVVAYCAVPLVPAPVLARSGDRPAVRAANVAAVVVCGCFVLVGLVALIGAAGLVLALGAGCLAAWWVVHRSREPEPAAGARVPAPRTPPKAAPEPAVPEHPESVASMSVADLCRAWRLSYLPLQTTADPDAMHRLAVMRRAYLDELERRDPAGFQRWLESGARAASDPARFIRARDVSS